MTGPAAGDDRHAPVYPLPVCPWCRHLWLSHWSERGCQAPTGPRQTYGCPEPPPDDTDEEAA